MWWNFAKTAAVTGFGGGIVKKSPASTQVAVSNLEKQQIANEASAVAQQRRTDPLQMTIEEKLRETPNRGGMMNIPPRVNPYQDTEASLELSGGDRNAPASRPDQHHRDGYGNYGGYDDQPPTSPNIAQNNYPV